MASLHAQLYDLLGHDPDQVDDRPSVDEAAQACPRGQLRPARDPRDGAPVVVLRLASGKVCVVADRCPHDGGPLSDGFLDGDRLVCARHQWEVDPATGACPRRPGARVDVRTCETA